MSRVIEISGCRVSYDVKRDCIEATPIEEGGAIRSFWRGTKYFCLNCGKKNVWQKDWDSEIGFGMHCSQCGAGWFSHEPDFTELDHPWIQEMRAGEKLKTEV